MYDTTIVVLLSCLRGAAGLEGNRDWVAQAERKGSPRGHKSGQTATLFSGLGCERACGSPFAPSLTLPRCDRGENLLLPPKGEGWDGGAISTKCSTDFQEASIRPLARIRGAVYNIKHYAMKPQSGSDGDCQ